MKRFGEFIIEKKKKEKQSSKDLKVWKSDEWKSKNKGKPGWGNEVKKSVHKSKKKTKFRKRKHKKKIDY